jgi:hypothetical protein
VVATLSTLAKEAVVTQPYEKWYPQARGILDTMDRDDPEWERTHRYVLGRQHQCSDRGHEFEVPTGLEMQPYTDKLPSGLLATCKWCGGKRPIWVDPKWCAHWERPEDGWTFFAKYFSPVEPS